MQEIVPVSVRFSPEQTLECGQVFRYRKRGDGYRVVARDKCADVTERNGEYVIDSNDAAYFHRYFDLDTDYAKIAEKLSATSETMRQAVACGEGIHILRQDRFEALVSFIVSQNNHIPRIRAILERIAEAAGEKKEWNGEPYYAFPTPERMAELDEEFFLRLGAGYRAPFLARIGRAVSEGFHLSEVDALPTHEAKKLLLSQLGVGPKVCDCVLLFGFHRLDVFPVDTWMEKAYYEYYEKKKRSVKQIAEFFTAKYGVYSGYAQQYLFYYMKKNK